MRPVAGGPTWDQRPWSSIAGTSQGLLEEVGLRHPIQVILCDRSPSVRLLLRSLLADDERFAVVAEVATAHQLFDEVDHADLVVLDLVLDDGDAFTVLDELRIARPSLPVVIFTDVDPPYLRAEAHAHGAAAFFRKSLDPREVLDGFAAVAHPRERSE